MTKFSNMVTTNHATLDHPSTRELVWLSQSHVLDSANGLPSNQVHRFAMDAGARLWMASPAGLACFDGSFVRTWDRSTGLQCNGLRCVAVDDAGLLWIGSDLGLELLDGAGPSSNVLEPGAWRFGLCQSIDISGTSPWLATAGGLVKLGRITGANYHHVEFHADVGFVNEVAKISENKILAATSTLGLVKSDGKTWWRYKCAELRGRRITRLSKGLSGQALIGTDVGLFVIDVSARQVLEHLSLPQWDSTVTAVAMGVDRCWVAYGKRLVAYSHTDQGSSTATEHYLAESPINDIHVDGLANVWIATNMSGLARVSCLRTALEKVELGGVGGIYSIRANGATGFHVGGENRYQNLDSQDCASDLPVAPATGLPNTTVWDSQMAQGEEWLAAHAGVFRADPRREFKRMFEKDTMLGAPARAIAEFNGDLWIGTLRGLSRLTRGTPKPVNDAAGMALGYVYDLFPDANGRLWISTLGRGLWYFEESQGLVPFAVGPLLGDGNNYAIHQGPDGHLAVLQDDKVVLIDTDLTPRILATLPPIAGWSVRWLDAQLLAVGASDGLRILEVPSGAVRQRINALFPQSEWEFTASNSLALEGDGNILCGTNSGLIRVRLDELRKFSAPPVCKLIDIAWSKVNPDYKDGSYRLAPGRWSFQVRAFSAWFVDHTQVRYQFMLIGFDDAWLPMSATPETYYNSLPAGQYRLQIRAWAPLTGFGPEAQLLRLSVGRPRWTFGLGAIFAAIETFYDTHVRAKTRNEALLERNRVLESEVAKRTASLQIANEELATARDTYLHLSEIDELTRLGNRRSFDQALARSIAFCRRLQLPLSLMMFDLDYFKMVNDRYGHPTGDEYLKSFGSILASAVRLGDDTAFRYGGEEFALILMNTSAEAALIPAENIRQAVQDKALVNQDAPAQIMTVSIGVATLQPDSEITAADLIQLADAELYRAKHGGRNRVCSHSG